MIDFNQLEKNKEIFREEFLLAKPFPYLVIDDFCRQDDAEALFNQLPKDYLRSRNNVFSRDKFEKKHCEINSEIYQLFYKELNSDRFQEFLSFVSNESVFIDPTYHGGGLSQTKAGSCLDMNLDFNYHPKHPEWFRNLNLFFYLNKDWEEEYGGHLIIEDFRTEESKKIPVPFNRLVIQQSRSFTLHGHDPIRFPKYTCKNSITSYAYSFHKNRVEKLRPISKAVKNKPNNFRDYVSYTLIN
ncbi:2OG-Fe(II) oxygenase [Reichenbachiella versicolor]|uniref:2OG-Fe(II) oxygenase n=1 Tax=Reichenbachiella versicolor TaxID=1821036 RepID=UPI000D6DCB3D|nr:2OG-Fe(II) oxygenase [Reichenbachiella versicolor]